MINHARTLLLNLPANSANTEPILSEYVPDVFAPLILSSAAAKVSSVLFGNNPDILYRHYAVRKFLTFLHSSPLESYLTRLDNRITYARVALNANKDFGKTTSLQVSGTKSSELYSATTAPTLNNICRRRWQISLVNAPSYSASINETVPLGQITLVPLSLSGDLSQEVPLPGSTLKMRFREDVGAVWSVETVTEPLVDLTKLVSSLGNLGAEVEAAIFSNVSDKAVSTFYNLWQDKQELGYKLSGFLLAYIYHLERLRVSDV